MSGGGLVQLVSVGAQDSVLTAGATITYWKLLYRRASAFASECVEQSFSGTVAFGSRITAVISRNGDLAHKSYLNITLPKIQTLDETANEHVVYCNECGYAVLDRVELEIGGQRIDYTTGHFLSVYHELATASEKEQGLNAMVGRIPESELRHPTKYWSPTSDESTGVVLNPLADQDPGTATVYDPFVIESGLRSQWPTLHVPLSTMFFHKHPGTCISLVALQYHEVRLQVTLASLHSILRKYTLADDASFGQRAEFAAVQASDYQLHGNLDVRLFVDMIYLDAEERRRHATVSHEVLVEQLQTQVENADIPMSSTGSTIFQQKYRLTFNHPVKWHAFTTVPRDASLFSSPFVCSRFPGNSRILSHPNPVAEARISLNGHDRIPVRDGTYFSLEQPYQCFPKIPDIMKPVNVYSYSLYALEAQPSGSVNMSRIDNAQLHIGFATYPGDGMTNPLPLGGENFDSVTKAEVDSDNVATRFGDRQVHIFAQNFNVLKITAGMGGMAYSN